MQKQQLDIIVQSLLADFFCKNYSELSDKEMRHINKYIDYDSIPDRILSDNEQLHPYINWSRISKMKAIRLVSKNFNLTKYINLKKYEYKIREIFWFIKSDYTRLFEFFNFDLSKCSHEDVYLLLCLGEDYFEKRIKLEDFKFSFIEIMDIIRAYRYRRDIVLRLDYPKLKNYQYTEILSNTGEDSIDLFDCLEKRGCKFAMSEFDNPFIIQQAKERNLNVIIIGERQNLKNRRTEILITNYNQRPNLFD
jgi:hypothetical protein